MDNDSYFLGCFDDCPLFSNKIMFNTLINVSLAKLTDLNQNINTVLLIIIIDVLKSAKLQVENSSKRPCGK